MDENRRLDDELAALTDAAIEKREMKTSEEMMELAEVVRGLRDLIEPGERPAETFEARMKQRLDAEWEQRQRRLFRPRVSNAVRVGTLAAALVLVLVVVISLTNTSPENGGLQGTALGSAETWVVLIGLAAAAGAAVLLWHKRR